MLSGVVNLSGRVKGPGKIVPGGGSILETMLLAVP